MLRDSALLLESCSKSFLIMTCHFPVISPNLNIYFPRPISKLSSPFFGVSVSFPLHCCPPDRTASWGHAHMMSALGGEGWSQKNRKTLQNQLISVVISSRGKKNSQNSGDVIFCSPLRKGGAPTSLHFSLSSIILFPSLVFLL